MSRIRVTSPALRKTIRAFANGDRRTLRLQTRHVERSQDHAGVHKLRTPREPTDPPGLALMQTQCDRCNRGPVAPEHYFDAQG